MTPKCYSYIRFSTPDQQKGDSLRRQLRMSEEYAKEHGLKLDPMSDHGLSAYKGEHRTKGALGRFLALIKEGKIPKGSTLIVESLDRLSREQVFDALDQFRDIIRAGIRIVTLADHMEYTQESINANIGQLMFSLTIMSRAYEESLTKAKRLKEAWSGKRENIAQKKLTARAPAWLRLNKDRTAFQPIPERAEIIKRIFQEKLAGKGTRPIAYELNQQTAWLPDTQKRNGGPPEWRESYIQKILRSPAVIGEYQPHELVDDAKGRRIRQPIGEPVKGYYPPVIPEELFYAVQARLEQGLAMAGQGGGRNGKINNLFGHIAKCGYCGASMAFINKGPLPKGGMYLVCDGARRKVNDCKRRPIRYDEFEELVLTYCKGLYPAELLPGNEERESTLRMLKGQLATVKGKKKEADTKVNNLADSIATTENPAVRRTLEDRLAQALDEQSSLEAEAKQLKKDIEQQTHALDDTRAKLESLRQLLAFLKERSGDELIDIRRRLREELRGLIDRIDVFPVGRPAMTEERIPESIAAVLDVQPELAGTEELKQFEAQLRSRIENKDLRFYYIHFKGGSWRIIDPAKPHKLSLEFDRENLKVRHVYQGRDGETVIRENKG